MTTRIIALFVLLAGAVPVRAQGYVNTMTGTQWNNPMSSMLDFTISQNIQKNIFEGSLRRQYGEALVTTGRARELPPPPTAPVHRVHVPITASDFEGTGRRTMPPALCEAGKTAGEKAQLAQMCRQILDAMEGEKGFRRNNVAFALTVLIGGSLQIAFEREVSERDTEQLTKELNDVLAGAESFRRMSAAERQSMYETAIITGGLIIGTYRQGVENNDPGMKRQAQMMASQVLAQFGVPVLPSSTRHSGG
jgi:hypothetical protein